MSNGSVHPEVLLKAEDALLREQIFRIFRDATAGPPSVVPRHLISCTNERFSDMLNPRTLGTLDSILTHPEPDDIDSHKGDERTAIDRVAQISEIGENILWTTA
ncbi:hypothetical protein C474_13624 [Halogeometricum pallidum JCM 14848]|uniref:Uncharacterized protein n=1 Tax=Halogeometricum pallidum JCM 14848 TaxID=1227487 RepID=M0D4N0_HALPD|nr:hypothetical protein C474_13624 [Halogeometricum pallidum JCM 14848]